MLKRKSTNKLDNLQFRSLNQPEMIFDYNLKNVQNITSIFSQLQKKSAQNGKKSNSYNCKTCVRRWGGGWVYLQVSGFDFL